MPCFNLRRSNLRSLQRCVNLNPAESAFACMMGDSYRRFFKCSLVVGFFCQLWLLVNMSTLCLFIFCRFTCNMLELDSLRPELTHDKGYMFQTVFCCHLHQPFNLSSKLLLLLDVCWTITTSIANCGLFFFDKNVYLRNYFYFQLSFFLLLLNLA